MREPRERREEWDKTGWKIVPSISKPGILKRLKWHQFVADNKRYDVLPEIEKLTMPVLLITGGEDHGTPPKDHRMLFRKLKCKKELHIIKGAPPTFREKEHLDQIKEIFRKWIKDVNQNLESNNIKTSKKTL